MSECMTLGLPRKKFLMKLASGVSDGGSDMLGDKIGLRGELMKQVSKVNGDFLWIHCIMHVLELDTKAFKDLEEVMLSKKVIAKTRAWFNYSTRRRQQLEKICDEYGYTFYYISLDLEQRWWISFQQCIQNWMRIHPVLLQYFDSEEGKTIESTVNQQDELSDIFVKSEEMKSMIVDPLTVYTMSCVADILAQFCGKLSLLAMGESVTTIQTYEKYMKVFRHFLNIERKI